MSSRSYLHELSRRPKHRNRRGDSVNSSIWYKLWALRSRSARLGLVALLVQMGGGRGTAQTLAALHLSRFIDPRIGSLGEGHVFTGPSLPFGMIKPGPDIGNNDANPGWRPDGPLNGFSQTHVSGTGGGAKYGNILLQPTTGQPNSDADISSPRREERQEVARYRVNLSRFNVDVDLTTAERSAIYTFDYHDAGIGNVFFDTAHCLSSYPKIGEDQRTVASTFHIVSSHELGGSTTVVGGWNKQVRPYTVYFAAMTDAEAASWGVWRDTLWKSGERESTSASAERSGGWLSFHPVRGRLLHLKIGISFVSESQARANLLREIPDFDAGKVYGQALAAWDRALSPLTLRGATAEQQRMVYTAIYHSMLMPVDRTGENPLWHSAEPYYDDFYAIWDIYRTSGPLLTLMAPDREAAIVRSLIDIYRHDGWLPDARTGNANGRTQGGSNAEFLLADAAVKNLPGIDWELAYRAARHDAEDAPADQLMEGRGGLEDWKKLGYVSIEGVDRPGSKQMEYAADDFEVGVLAEKAHHPQEALHYFDTSRNWQKLWNPAFTESGFSGFIQPRHRDGKWKERFTALDHCTWGGDTFYEGNSWTYSFFVPHDETAVVSLMGGRNQFVDRLDAFFAVQGRYNVGDEPGFLSPYLYLWAGQHRKTASRISTILNKDFHDTPDGLPGNDDSGAMSSWWLFGALGFYPNAGQDVYLIGSPQIPESSFHLANGKTFTVRAEGGSKQNVYVASALWRGKPLHRAWLRHSELMEGGVLRLTMSSEPSAWDSGPPPPSASDRNTSKR